jgi:hypothetical protein
MTVTEIKLGAINSMAPPKKDAAGTACFFDSDKSLPW